MAGVNLPLLANVTEPGDIVLLAIVLAATLVVGLGLLGIDTAVGRLRRRGAESAAARQGAGAAAVGDHDPDLL